MLLRDFKQLQASKRQTSLIGLPSSPQTSARRERTLTSTQKRLCFSRKVRSCYGKCSLEPVDREVLDALLGWRGRAAELLWSDMRALGQASRSATAMLLALFDNAPAERRFYWITLSDDVGTTSDRVPIVALDAVRKKAGKALRSAGLHALMALHVHPVINHPRRGLGRSLMFHYHAIAWTDHVEFDAEAFATAIEDARAWCNSLGGPVVEIKAVEARARLRTDARYMFRAAHDAKNRKPCKHRPETLILEDTIKAYRPELAMRVAECMSQIGLCEIFTGINDGRAMASVLRASLMQWHRKRPQPIKVPADYDVWELWARLRRTFGSKRFQPFRIRGGGAAPRLDLAERWAQLEASDRASSSKRKKVRGHTTRVRR